MQDRAKVFLLTSMDILETFHIKKIDK